MGEGGEDRTHWSPDSAAQRFWNAKPFPWGKFGALRLGEGETYSGDFGESRVRALVPCGAWVEFVLFGTAEAVPFHEPIPRVRHTMLRREVQRSFVGSRSLRGRLRCLRMTIRGMSGGGDGWRHWSPHSAVRRFWSAKLPWEVRALLLGEGETYCGDFGESRVRALVPCGACVVFVLFGTAEAVPFHEPIPRVRHSLRRREVRRSFVGSRLLHGRHRCHRMTGLRLVGEEGAVRHSTFTSGLADSARFIRLDPVAFGSPSLTLPHRTRKG